MEILLSVIAALAVMKHTTKYFFTNGIDLLESIKYWFQPASSRLLSRHLDGDFWRELRLFVWLLLGILSGYATYRFLLS